MCLRCNHAQCQIQTLLNVSCPIDRAREGDLVTFHEYWPLVFYVVTCEMDVTKAEPIFILCCNELEECNRRGFTKPFPFYESPVVRILDAQPPTVQLSTTVASTEGKKCTHA